MQFIYPFHWLFGSHKNGLTVQNLLLIPTIAADLEHIYENLIPDAGAVIVHLIDEGVIPTMKPVVVHVTANITTTKDKKKKAEALLCIKEQYVCTNRGRTRNIAACKMRRGRSGREKNTRKRKKCDSEIFRHPQYYHTTRPKWSKGAASLLKTTSCARKWG